MEQLPVQPIVAVVISTLIAARAYRRKSLDLSGAVAGFLVMSIHFAVSYRYVVRVWLMLSIDCVKLLLLICVCVLIIL